LDYDIILGVVATLIVLAGYFVYFKDILFGDTKPHAFTWLIWAVLNTVTFFASTSKGAGAGAWSIGVSGALNYVIFGIALFKGEKRISVGDTACLIAAFVGVGIWAITANPLWSIIIASVVDGLGFLPTFRKAYRKPREESLLTFSLTGTSYFLSLFAITTINLVTVLYPAVTFLMDAAFVLLILYRRRRA
jgi:hypothetical protein